MKTKKIAQKYVVMGRFLGICSRQRALATTTPMMKAPIAAEKPSWLDMIENAKHMPSRRLYSNSLVPTFAMRSIAFGTSKPPIIRVPPMKTTSFSSRIKAEVSDMVCKTAL